MSGASILIIDDDVGICHMVGDFLGLKGYAVETATSGGAGLEKLRARPFDAAIVDIMLPDISTCSTSSTPSLTPPPSDAAGKRTDNLGLEPYLCILKVSPPPCWPGK
jgi:CheY-like chemotaxis protein